MDVHTSARDRRLTTRIRSLPSTNRSPLSDNLRRGTINGLNIFRYSIGINLMLNIRQEQMDEFEARQLDRFVRDARDFLRSIWANEIDELGADETDLLIRDMISRAADWGIDRERQVLRLLNVCLAMGPEFPDSEEDGWALELLEDEAIDDDEKLAALESGAEERISD